MPDVTADLMDIAGVRDAGIASVRSLVVRSGELPTQIVTDRWHDFPFVDGDIALRDLDPGPAEVLIRTWGFRRSWRIEVPDTDGEITLWPLIDAGTAPPQPNSGFIRSRTLTHEEVMTQDQYAALPSPDPHTKYVITEEEV